MSLMKKIEEWSTIKVKVRNPNVGPMPDKKND